MRGKYKVKVFSWVTVLNCNTFFPASLCKYDWWKWACSARISSHQPAFKAIIRAVIATRWLRSQQLNKSHSTLAYVEPGGTKSCPALDFGGVNATLELQCLHKRCSFCNYSLNLDTTSLCSYHWLYKTTRLSIPSPLAFPNRKYQSVPKNHW